jgi:Holliday junction resolvase RusA-like endonuclease
MRMIAFTVVGVPQAKGNMKAFLPPGSRFPVVTERNKHVRSWAALIAEEAGRAMQAPGARMFIDVPVRVTAAFHLPRPKKFSKRGVPVAHLTAPDLDKLTRAILDPLKQIVWGDDSQVVELVVLKRYADVDAAPRVLIRIEATAGVYAADVPPAPMPLFDEAALFKEA